MSSFVIHQLKLFFLFHIILAKKVINNDFSRVTREEIPVGILNKLAGTNIDTLDGKQTDDMLRQ